MREGQWIGALRRASASAGIVRSPLLSCIASCNVFSFHLFLVCCTTHHVTAAFDDHALSLPADIDMSLR